MTSPDQQPDLQLIEFPIILGESPVSEDRNFSAASIRGVLKSIIEDNHQPQSRNMRVRSRLTGYDDDRS